jgi:hypothetical protein
LALAPVPAIKGNSLIPLTPNSSDYNLFYGPSAMSFFRGSEDRAATTLVEWQASSQLDAHSQWADPKFIKGPRNGPKADFRTLSQSPARRSGISLPEVPGDVKDFARSPRTDIGAYESH